MPPPVKTMDVRRHVLIAAVIALLPFALLKAFWPVAVQPSSPDSPAASSGAAGFPEASPGQAAVPASFADILVYLNQHKSLAKMPDAPDLALPDIARYARNQISFSYTDHQLNDFQYADGNNTASYVSRHFQQIICNQYPPHIRQVFVQNYISFRLILQNRNQYIVLSEAFNPQHCPAAPEQS